MPLATLSNFSESGYRERTRLLLSTVPSGPEAIWGLSWEELLVGHQWRGQGWRSAVRTRAELTKRLEAAQDAAGFAAAANAITSWGGLPPFSTDDLACLRTAVGALPRIDRGDASALDEILGRRIAATSKIYAMTDTERWVIYDSRVARGLALLVQHAGAADPQLTIFPQPPGRMPGRAAPGAPRLQHHQTRQAVLAFVYASWLCRAIAVQLNANAVAHPAGSTWTALHVELSLFAAGALPILNINDDRSDHMSPPAAAVAGQAAKALIAMGLADGAKDFATSEAGRRLAHRNAFRNAVRFGQQTKGLMVRLQFADGEQRYVVFKDDQPIAAFPPFFGDLTDALAWHEPEAMKRLSPEDALEHRRAARARRGVRDRLRRHKDEDEPAAEGGVPSAILALPAGDPLGEDELLDDVFDDPDE